MQFGYLFALATAFGIATPVMARRCVVEMVGRDGTFEFVNDREYCIPPEPMLQFGQKTDLRPKKPGYKFFVNVDAGCTTAVHVKGKMPKGYYFRTQWEN